MKGSPDQYPGEVMNDVPHDLQLLISPLNESPALSALDMLSDDLIITTTTSPLPLSAHDASFSQSGPISPAPTSESPAPLEEEVLPKRKAEEDLGSEAQRKKAKTEINNSLAPKAPKEKFKISPSGASSDAKRRTTGVQVLVKKVSADKLPAHGKKTGVQVVTTIRRKPISKSSDERRGSSSASAKQPPPAASCSRTQPLPPRPSSPSQSRASGLKPIASGSQSTPFKRPQAPTKAVIKRPASAPAVPSTSAESLVLDVCPKASSSEPSLPEASSLRSVSADAPVKASTSERSLVDVRPSVGNPDSSSMDVQPSASSARSTSVDVAPHASSSVSIDDTDEQPHKRPTKPKRAPTKRRPTPVFDSDSDSEPEIDKTPPPPPPLPTSVDPELVGMLIETFATSRASSLTLSTAYKSLMSTRPGIKARHSEAEWMGILGDVLEKGDGGVFGKVESSRKDASDRTLEARWFYNPEADADQERATLLRSMMPRPGKRAVTKRYKQYYYQPVATLRTWPGEEDLW